MTISVSHVNFKVHRPQAQRTNVKVKVKSNTCYSASYIRRTREQKRFTISDVTADWHKLIIPQRTMRPSIARVNEQ